MVEGLLDDIIDAQLEANMGKDHHGHSSAAKMKLMGAMYNAQLKRLQGQHLGGWTLCRMLYHCFHRRATNNNADLVLVRILQTKAIMIPPPHGTRLRILLGRKPNPLPR